MNPIQYQQMVKDRVWNSVTNKQECFEDVLVKAHNEIAETDKEYKKKVKKLLKEYGVDKIEDLSDKQKKQFFSKLDASRTSEKEMKKGEGVNKDQAIIQKAYDILGVDILQSFSDIIKSDVQHAFSGYGGGDNFLIDKKGSEIKSMAQTKKSIYQSKKQAKQTSLAQYKAQLDEKGVALQVVGEYGYQMPDWGSSSEQYSDETRHLIYKYEDCIFEIRNIDSDIEILDIIIENVKEDKTYNVTANQIASLKP